MPLTASDWYQDDTTPISVEVNSRVPNCETLTAFPSCWQYESCWSLWLLSAAVVSCVILAMFSPTKATELGVHMSAGRIEFVGGDHPIATYVYRDPEIPRPYFAHLRGPGGIQVSRNHPPIEGRDNTDHPTFHPGLWLAFGDLSGADNWRNKAAVRHVKMLQPPTVIDNTVSFAVENEYAPATEGLAPICHERCRYELHDTEHGYLLTWDSTLWGDDAFSFGDQEEMGLGIRVATPLRVEMGGDGLSPGTGTILDSQGRRNADEVWGRSAQWVDYSGLLDGRPAGIAVLCHPDNFRPSYFHARDYGFLTANPFSEAAFRRGPSIITTVEPGETLRLRYGVLLHAEETLDAADLTTSYKRYLKLANPVDSQP